MGTDAARAFKARGASGRRWLALASALIAWVFAGLTVAQAQVQLTFYAREYGEQFPHTFVRVTGATEAAPRTPLDTNYGFTAVSITPALLVGPSAGKIETVSRPYLQKATPYLTLTLTDAQYGLVMSVVRKWGERSQPSYDLHRRNCVFFVAEIAQALGLGFTWRSEYVLGPTKFMLHLQQRNPNFVTDAQHSLAGR